jgi:hypothetical protein
MKAIYNKTTGQILVIISDIADVEIVKSNWPNICDYTTIDAVPPKKEFGQWHINLETKTLEKIS